MNVNVQNAGVNSEVRSDFTREELEWIYEGLRAIAAQHRGKEAFIHLRCKTADLLNRALIKELEVQPGGAR